MDSSRLKSQSREAWSQFVSLVTMDLKIAKNQKQRGKKRGGGGRKKGRKEENEGLERSCQYERSSGWK